MIRFADYSDRLRVVALLRDFHQEAKPGFPFEAARAEAVFKMHLGSVQACCIVMGRPAHGVLLAAAAVHPFSGRLIAEETIWYVRPAYRGRGSLGLVDAYEEWAAKIGCDQTVMTSLASHDVSSIYRRLGYRPAETHFLKDL